MKKIFIFAVLFLSLGAFSYDFDSLPQNTKDYIKETIAFYQKLSTCTPSVFSKGGVEMSITGAKNGVCKWSSSAKGTTLTNSKTGEVIKLDKCKYSASLADTKDFAQKNIKLTKAVYSIDNTTVTQSELANISNTLFNIQKKYCK